MAANERVVNLAIRAKDEFSKVFKNLEEAGRKTQLLFVRDTRKALNETQVEIKKVSNELRQLTQAEGDNRQAVANLVIAKGKLIEKAANLQGNLDRVLDSVRRNKVEANGGYAAFSKMADGMDFTKARAETLQREITELNAAIADSVNKQRTLVSKNPFAAADAGRDASNYIAAARAKKEEIRALMIEQRKASGVTQSNIREWFQYSNTLRAAYTSTENITAAVAAAVPTLKQKEVASEKAAQAERVHAAAMDGTTRAARRQSAALTANNRQGARQRNQGLRGDAQEIEVWGLKPWQLTNLGYQINDVVSGFAMGQAPVQILAQQAGQFAQIWPGVMVNLARSIPILAAVGAVLSPVIAAFGRAAAERDALRSFTAELALSADGARYTAEELTQTAIALRGMGVELGKARDLVKMFLSEGFQPREIAGLTRMAQQLVEVTGQDLPTAAQRIARAFNGNVSTVRELDRELNFLTSTQYEQIRAMEQSGDRAGALASAQEILRNRLASTVQPTTEWGDAVTKLKDSWDSLVESIGDSGIVELGAAALELLALSALGAAIVVEEATDLIAGSEETLAERYGRLNKRRQELQTEIARALADDRNARFGDPEDSREVRELRNMLAQVEAEYQDVVAQIKAFGSEQSKATETVEETVSATEEQLKNATDIDDVIKSQLDGMQNQLETSLLTSREQYIQNALLEARNAALQRAKELGVDFLDLTEEQTAAIKSQAGAIFDAQTRRNLLESGMSSFVDRVVGVESGGNVNAKNPNSTATGLGQFIESTWLRMFEQYFPDRAANMNREAILALRKDAEISRQMIELYARENAEVLQKAGVAVNEASLYLAHFLGPRGAAGVMAATASTPVDQILSADQINANGSILQGRNAGEVRDWAARKMGITQAELVANERLLEIDRDRADTVRDYNKSYEERIADLQTEIAATAQSGREAAILSAIRQEEIEAARAGLELTQQQRQEIADLTGQLFDRQNVEAEVNALMEQREIIMQRLQMVNNANDQVGINSTLMELSTIDDALESAIDRAIAFWDAMGGQASEQAIQRLRLMRDELQQTSEEMSTKYLPAALEVNEQLAEVGANAFDKLAQAAAQGKLTFASFFDALRQGIAQFLIDIGKAIIKQAIFNAISGGAVNGGGGAGGFITGLIGRIFHDGGVVGSSATPSRMVNPAVFAGAARYHIGGKVGLKPGEVPIIAEEGEIIDPGDGSVFKKHFGNGQQTNVKVVNVLDPTEILQSALSSDVGEKAFINFMARRSRQINGVLGS